MKMYMPNMKLHIVLCLPLLLVLLAVEAFESNQNATDSGRAPRNSRRAVRLYSGTRPDPLVCLGEGFQADPVNCAVFYRCMKSGRGRFMSFKFQCAPGTIYDPETEVCNHPSTVKRSGCGIEHTASVNEAIHDNAIEEIRQELPSPISTKNPFYIDISGSATAHPWSTSSKQQSVSTTYPWLTSTNDQIKDKFTSTATKIPAIETSSQIFTELTFSSTRKQRSTTPRASSDTRQQIGDQCTSEGFIGDSENCRKFYRCISNLRGGYIRYEFMCTESTIWDDDIQSCNHAWAVKRRRCGRGNVNEVTGDNKNQEIGEEFKDNKVIFNTIQPEKQQTNSHWLESQTQASTNHIMQTPKSTVITTVKTNKQAPKSTIITTTKMNTPTTKSTLITTAIISTSSSPNSLDVTHTQRSSTESRLTFPKNEENTVGYNNNMELSREPDSSECSESGFMGDKNDCKKFYRCVDNGRGSYTKYEFTCGEGTVWDPNLDACNHAWAVKECGGKGSTKYPASAAPSSTISTVSSTESTTTHTSTSSKQPPTTNDDEDVGYGNQNPTTALLTTKSPSSTTKLPSSSSSTQATKQPGNNCVSSGFMGDENDCKKFYRCVDNGGGSFTRYEFTCGEGTVWDPNLDACNHAWAVSKCGGSSSASTEIISQTTASPSATTQVFQTTGTQNDESDNGYGMQHDENPSPQIETTSKSTTTTLKQPQSSSNNCTSDGFIGDQFDCKKFYRCVDNGNGVFTRYEFTCGEGTVWDPEISACNHAWAVKDCGGLGNEINNEEVMSSHGTTTTILSSSLSGASEENDIDTGYGQSSTQPTIVSSSETATEENGLSIQNECKSNGFMGDNSNCKKFYRCVDNGNGGFTRYEFTCGEGTVWDSKIQACNHEWAVEDCSGSSNNINKEETTTIRDNSTSGSSQTTSDNISQSTTTVAVTQIPNESSNICTSSGFMGDNKNCKKFYRCVDNGNGGYTKYEFTCGDGTVWNQEIQACDHDNGRPCTEIGNTTTTLLPENDEMYSDNNTKEPSSSSEKPIYENTSSTETSSQITGTCQLEGFYGDPNDCKKFYRCVDNGKGSYTKYEFSCGDGTIWDQKIQACNHETNSECQTTNIDSNNHAETTNNSLSTTTSSYTELTESQSSPVITTNVDVCTSEGFYANSKDCRKFYRCVDNGKGGYTKYDFSCGEGTMWVQDLQACDHEDDDLKCSNSGITEPLQSENQQTSTEYQSSAVTSSATSESTERPNDEYQESQSAPTKDDGSCSSEGFYPNKNDCKKFYRCVDNGQGGYTIYDFTCGEGTAWDADIQTCNHENEVMRCRSDPGNNNDNSQNKPIQDEGTSQTTESSDSTQKPTSQSSGSSSSGKNSCDNEGYFGNTQDCTQFYRCVDNGNGGYTKYDFDCGEGTIWDQDIQTCNHPQDVVNPSCKQQSEMSSTSSSTTQSSHTENTSQSSSNCSQENTTKKPVNQNITCEKAGYYANPNDCKKFYRCVDWDGNGERFSVYHFECGEGTIWDPQLDTCNHEESVYPPRDCSGAQSQNENVQETTSSSTSSQTTEPSTQDSTTEQSTTEKTTTTTTEGTTQPTTTESTTTQQSTTSQSTTSQQSITEGTTTQKSTTEETTTQQSTTTESTTKSTTESTTTQQSTTEESTTTTTEGTTTTIEGTSTTSEGTTTSTEGTTTTSEGTTTTSEDTTTTSEGTTTTTEGTTTTESTTAQQESTTTESTTTQQTTTEGTTSATDVTTTQQSTTSQTSTTNSQTTESTNTEESTDNQSTTESSNTEETKDCPDTEDDQYLYVCPTSFKRHPKYCNMFYQCTEDDDSHEPKIAVFTCPNNTIYDESKTQCVEENKADKKCDGEIAQRRRLKRLNTNYKEPIVVGRDKYSCPSIGFYPFEKTSECSPAFLKCQKNKSGKLRGYVHLCPEGYLYWSISKRCEKKETMKYCKTSANDWSRRWEIPTERKNIAL